MEGEEEQKPKAFFFDSLSLSLSLLLIQTKKIFSESKHSAQHLKPLRSVRHYHSVPQWRLLLLRFLSCRIW
uniref:Uncharacterized protein n=1 Tax=Cannabis sativa TaxID=3483 RepID=A0A803R0X7_CANSA